jgi:hypothetical protein
LVLDSNTSVQLSAKLLADMQAEASSISIDVSSRLKRIERLEKKTKLFILNANSAVNNFDD